MKRVKKEKTKKNTASYLLKGLVTALVVTFIFMAVAAALVTYTNMEENVVTYISFASTCISALICGFISGRGAKNKGVLWGVFSGFIYVIIMIAIIKTVVKTDTLGASVIWTVVEAVLCGALGGILGINTKK
ncbi:MAG: TIGR04086 family membrane protein [Clostridia bacterium]|jgi:putative membrane protein (TIGR04086 family)|nr:TIGR04086 family membrane protein [Clostridia bacterium]MCI2000671.1 TIGR04086 family membrane protein [Clostridia bacterium]MCI2015256.1 TIGR04086 family membrane protein [Clostridia bacterium]